MKTLIVGAWFLFSLVRPTQAEEVPAYARVNFQNWAFHSDHIVDVCVYKRVWKAPTEAYPKGISTLHSVVVKVHKGRMEVGTKLIYTRYKEFSAKEWQEAARERPDAIEIVEGNLRTVMFGNEDREMIQEGVQLIGDMGHTFDYGDEFYRAMLARKLVDPELKGTLGEE